MEPEERISILNVDKIIIFIFVLFLFFVLLLVTVSFIGVPEDVVEGSSPSQGIRRVES